LSSGDDGGNVV